MSSAIAFFDVDRTICDCYSGYYSTLELIRLGIIKKRRLVEAIVYKTTGHLFQKMNVRRMYEITLADLAGMCLDEIMKIGQKVFEKDVRPKIYREAIAEIEKLRRENYEIVLISSGPYMSIKIIEDFLHADASFSVGPVVKDGILQKEVAEPICYKEGKVLAAKNYAEAKGFSLRDCLFYSDSYSDLPLLSEVGGPRAVNPDRFLRREALRRSWPILRFKNLLGKR